MQAVRMGPLGALFYFPKQRTPAAEAAAIQEADHE
jgi:hypothetical protein